MAIVASSNGLVLGQSFKRDANKHCRIRIASLDAFHKRFSNGSERV